MKHQLYEQLEAAAFGWTGRPLTFTSTKFWQWVAMQRPVKNPAIYIIDKSKRVTLQNIRLVETKGSRAGKSPEREIACINIYTGRITRFTSIREAGRIMGVYYKSLIQYAGRRRVVNSHRWFFPTATSPF